MPTSPQIEKVDVLIVTAADGEDTAVRKIFGEDWERIAPVPPINLFWHKITLTSKKGRRFTVALVRADMGTDNAGPITQKMIDHLRPHFIAMCGICAGHPKDTKIGDVIIASKVFRYDQISVTALPDGSLDKKWDDTPFSLAQSWWQLANLLDEDIPDIRIHTAPMATGSALCRNPAIWEEIGKYQRKCISLEMEASVIGQIGHIEEKRWVVVKGVSDYATPKKNNRYHVLAKENAAKVLKEFLENVADELPSIDNVDGVWVPPVVIGKKTMNPTNVAPSTLLHAKNEVVPFSDVIRQPEFEALRALCQPDGASQGIFQLFTGAGGIGKTRLMIEWARRLKETDATWQTCFLTQGIDPNSQDFKDIFSQDNHLFFVIDYAECRTNLSAILRILVAAAKEKPGRMVRATLLARHADVWWKELSTNNLDISGYLHDRVVELRDVPIQNDMRQRLFDNAFQAFAEKTNNLSSEEAITKAYAMLTDSVFGRVLYIHMAAYATVMGLSFTTQNLLDVIVSYEKHFWTIQFREKIDGEQAKNKFIRDTSRVLAALTLFGGVDTPVKLTNLINTSQGPIDDLFLEFLHNFYPPDSPQKTTGYLEPDLLGEHLVFDTLRSLRSQKNPFTDSTFLTNTFNLTDDPDELQQAFTVLGRIAEHDTCKTDPEKTMIEEWLSLPFDEAHLGIRSLPAAGAALSLAEKTAFCPIPDILKNALEKWGSVSSAQKIWGVLPNDSVAFRRLQFWVAETILNDLKCKERLTQEQHYDYAHALLFYSTALAELGQRDEALKAICEAVDSYRSSVESFSNAFLPGLARSLDSLGNILSELGPPEAALDATREAVDLYRSLAEFNPEDFLADLPGSINNLGNRLNELGKYNEALEAYNEAVDTYRLLAETNPKTFLPHLAMSLNNQGTNLTKFGQRDEAPKKIQEAVNIYRSLAISRPDAFLPCLADSLMNLGYSLNECGLGKEALEATREAVDIYRSLTESHSNAFLSDLAMCLDCLGNNLCKMKQRKEALEATMEAVDIYRSLTASSSDAFLPDLARSLNNLGIRFGNLDLYEAALDATREAVDIYRPLTASHPDVFISYLIRSLNTLGNSLRGLDRCEEALEIAQEAVDTCRPLAASCPEVFLPYLAGTLNNLGNNLGDLDRDDKALDAISEAVNIYRLLVESWPDAFLPELAMSLDNLGITFSDLGRREDALKTIREAVDTHRLLVASYPDAFLADLAGSLNNLGAAFSDLGQHEEALEAYNEAFPIIQPLVQKYPQIFERPLYRNLSGKIQALRAIGGEEEMLPEEMEKLAELRLKYGEE